MDHPGLSQRQSSVVDRDPQWFNNPDAGFSKVHSEGSGQHPVLKNTAGKENHPDAGPFPGPVDPIPEPKGEGSMEEGGPPFPVFLPGQASQQWKKVEDSPVGKPTRVPDTHFGRGHIRKSPPGSPLQPLSGPSFHLHGPLPRKTQGFLSPQKGVGGVEKSSRTAR